MTGPFRGVEPAPGLVVATTLRSAAGSPLPVEVTLTNSAAEPRVLSVGAIGVDAGWLPPLARTGVLEPGQSVVLTMTLTPATGTVPAQYPLAFTAQAIDPSTGQPSGAPAAMIDSVLVVNPRNQLTLTLEPRSVSTVSSRKVTLTLRNSGGEPARVRLDVQTSPRLLVRFKSTDIDVLPGDTRQVRGRVSVPRGRLIGSVVHHNYTVTAKGTESLRHVDGSVTQRALIGTLWLKVVSVLVMLSIWIAAAVIFVPQLSDRIGGGGQDDTTTATVDNGEGAGGEGSGDGSGGEGSGGEGSGDGSGGDKGGGSGGDKSGGGGGTKQAADTDEETMALGGTVAGDQPGGVLVSLEPTSLVDEDAQGGVGVGVPQSQLGNTGMSLASSFLNRAVEEAAPTRTARTSPDGSWAFAKVRKPGYYLLTFSKPGYQSRAYVIDSTSETASEPLEVDLSPGEGTLSGTVSGPDGPVGAATVTITDGTNTLTTSSNSRGRVGRWSVSGLSTPGAYVVQVSKPGLSSESRMVDLGAGGRAIADLELRAGVASLVGQVRAVDESGELTGVGGVQVTVTGEDGTTRSATTLTQGAPVNRGSSVRAAADFVGAYTVPGLPVPGTYVVTYSGPGLQTQTSRVTFRRGQSRANVDADLVAATGSVVGTVSGNETGGSVVPVVGAGLTLANADNTYKTMSTSDPAGSFLFNGVAPGTYLLATEFFGFVTGAVTVTVNAGQTATVNPSVDQLQGGVLARRSSVQGRAVDGSNAAPVDCSGSVPDCLVATVIEPGVDDGPGDDIPYETSFLPTDMFRLPDQTTDGLLPGLHTVRVSAPHFSSASVTVQVPSDGTVDVGTLSLLPAPRIVGTISAVVGTPTDKTCVWAVPDGEDPPAMGCDTTPTGDAASCQDTTATFDAGGADSVCAYVELEEPGAGGYSLEVPAAGSYDVYVRPADAEYLSPPPGSVLLDAGVTRNQSVQLNRLGRLLVTVKKSGPSGLVSSVGTTVVLNPVPAGAPGWNVTDSAGTTTVIGVPAGSYTASASDAAEPSLVGSQTFSVGVNQDRQVRLSLTNPIGTVIGQVTTSFNGVSQPLAGVDLTVTAPVGYDSSDNANRAPVTVRTDSQGCFAIQRLDPAGGPPLPAPSAGPCDSTWPTSGAPAVPSLGRITFLSSVASTIKITRTGYGDVNLENQTLSTGSTLNTFVLEALAVPLGTVPLQTAPTDSGFDWSQVSFSVDPAGNPTAITATGTGTGTGELTWSDTRVPAATRSNRVLPGTYTVTATRSGYSSDTGTLVCPLPSVGSCAWGTAPDGDLVLSRLGSLEIGAEDPLDNPVPDARYILFKGTTAIQTIVGSGTSPVTFENLDSEATDYRVRVQAAGYGFGDTDTLTTACTPGGADIDIAPGAETSCTVEVTRIGAVTGTLAGVRALPPAETPFIDLVGATVRVTRCLTVNAGYCTATNDSLSFTATTSTGGTFRVTGTNVDAGLDGGDWLVTASSPGYSLPPVPGGAPAGAKAGVLVTGLVNNVDTAVIGLRLHLDPVDFSVQLLDSSGALFPGATLQLVRITSGGTEVFGTATEGATSYAFEDIVPGSYVLKAFGNGLQVATQTINITSAANQEFTMTVVRAANTAFGTVTASDPAGPLAGAVVELCTTADCVGGPVTGSNGSLIDDPTDSAGAFLYRNVPDGNLYVRVSKYGYRTKFLGPFQFAHDLGGVPAINTTLDRVTRTVAITVERTWSNANLTGGSVTISNGGPPVAPASLALIGGEYVATFNQVKSGCWTVAVTNPVNHFGTAGALENRPTDAQILSCAADNEFKVPGTDASTSTVPDVAPATADTTLNEGRLDLTLATTPHPDFPATVLGPVNLTVTRGTTLYTNATFPVSATPTEIWVPAGGGAYTVHAGLVTPNLFWPDDEESVSVPATKPPAAPSVLAALEIKEVAATLVVTVTGAAGGDPQATLTIGRTELPAMTIPSAPTVGYTKTYTLPAGTWNVTATVPGKSGSGSRTITTPLSAGPGGVYTLTIPLT